MTADNKVIPLLSRQARIELTAINQYFLQPRMDHAAS